MYLVSVWHLSAENNIAPTKVEIIFTWASDKKLRCIFDIVLTRMKLQGPETTKINAKYTALDLFGCSLLLLVLSKQQYISCLAMNMRLGCIYDIIF